MNYKKSNIAAKNIEYKIIIERNIKNIFTIF